MKNKMNIGAIASAASMALVFGGAALGQSAPISPAPPAPPDAPSTSTHTSGSWSMSRTENGRTVKVEGHDGAVTAEIDGKAVPADRIERDGALITIKDEQGKVVFEEQVMEPQSITIFQGGSGTASPFARTMPHGSIRSYNSGPFQGRIVEPIEQPKAMIGVQLIEPDASLRGHLGLKEGESALVSGVYEGLPASAAGLEPYDIIVSIGGKGPASPEVVRKALREKDAGQSVQMEVLHRGQRKAIELTLEKYDREKMDKAKVSAIAAASGSNDEIMQNLSVAPAAPGQVWTYSNGRGPIVGQLSGPDGKTRNQIFWKIDEETAKQHQDIAQQAEEMARQMQAQAEKMREQWEKSGGMAQYNQQMDDRMKRMEELLRQMMEQKAKQQPEQPKADQKQSLLRARLNSMAS